MNVLLTGTSPGTVWQGNDLRSGGAYLADRWKAGASAWRLGVLRRHFQLSKVERSHQHALDLQSGLKE